MRFRTSHEDHYMNTRLFLKTSDLITINNIIKENDLTNFFLVINNNSGIGSTVNVEFETKLHNRDVIISVPVTTVENW